MIDKIFQLTLKVFIVWGTFFYLATPKDIGSLENAVELSYQVQEMFFRYGTMLLFGMSMLIERKRQLKFVEGILLFSVLLISSCFLNGFPLYSRRALLNLATGLVLYRTIFEFVDLKGLVSWSKWFFWLLVVNGLFCLMQYFRCDFLFQNPDGHIVPRNELMVGLMKMKANLGVLVALVAPWFLLMRWKWLTLSFLVAIPLIIIGETSAGILAMLAGVIFPLYFRNKRLFYVLFGLCAVAGTFYVLYYDMPSGQFDKRLIIWWRALREVVPSSPILGFGLGSFAQWEPQMIQETVVEKLGFIWAHNEFIQLLFEGGILSLIIVILYVKRMCLGFLKSVRNKELCVLFGVFLSVLVISFFHFPFHVGKFACYCVFGMALFHALLQENRKVTA